MCTNDVSRWPKARNESYKKILGVLGDYEVATLIPIGYPKPYKVKQKPVLLQNKIHIDKW